MQQTNGSLKLTIWLSMILLGSISAMGQNDIPHQIKWFATELHADAANVLFPVPEFSVKFNSDSIIVTSNGVPSFEFVAKTPNGLKAQSHNWVIPTSPVPATTLTQIPLLGTVAFTTTGLPIYGPNEAQHPDPYGDPYVNQILDYCHGHTGGQGDYHFHAAPECLIQHPDGSEEHYNIIGFALDGYPLIAHYKSVLDASGNPILDADGETQFDWLETSGYEPKPAYKRQVIEGGAISTYAWDNYEYEVNRAKRTLDEGNGRLLTDKIITEGLSEREFFRFDYGYFITGEFPYFIAKYRGEINIRNQRPNIEGPENDRPPRLDEAEGDRPPRPDGAEGDRSPQSEVTEGEGHHELDEKSDPKVGPETNDATAQLVFSEIETVNLDSSFWLNLLLIGDFQLAGWQTDFIYNPQVLELLAVKEGQVLTNTFFQEGKIDHKAGRLQGLSSALLDQGVVSNPGTLLSLRFKSIKEGESVVRLENTILGNDQAKPLKISVKDTVIKVISSPPCDVNADGVTNIFDLILVAQKFGQKNVTGRTDTNGDGEINVFDLIIVAQCFGQAAAPSTVSQPESMSQLIKGWIGLSQTVDDGSTEFQQGVLMLKQILESLKPKQTALLPNYPNPFNPETWIPFKLAQDSTVTAKIYDLTGKQIRRIELGHIPAGNYVESNRAIYWDGKTDTGEFVSSGTYFYQIETDDYTETRKMVILK